MKNVVLRRALFGWAFNPSASGQPPAEVAAALHWAERASLPVSVLENPAIVRAALDACSRTVGGAPAAATTLRRKRAVFHNALAYAVEQGLLAANPVDRVHWTAPEVAQTVDRRVVVSPAQAAALFAAARGQRSAPGRPPAQFKDRRKGTLPTPLSQLTSRNRDTDAVLPGPR